MVAGEHTRRNGAGGLRAERGGGLQWTEDTAGRERGGGKVQGIRLEMVNHPETKRGFVLLPRRRVVECSIAWATRIRRLVRDYERLPETMAGLLCQPLPV